MTIVEREGVFHGPGGRKIGWILRGPESGRVIAYLHGQPGSRYDVRFFEDALVRYGVRLLGIDRGGYGSTDPAGLDRRDVVRDLLTVADHLGVGEFPVLAVSQGGVYALTLAAIAPERVKRVVMVSGHVLPYDDPEVIADLSDAERKDLDALREGRTPATEERFAKNAAEAASVAGSAKLVRRLAETMSPREQHLAAGPFAERVAESLASGLSTGHVGYLEDGLRTIRPLEVDLADVKCPVRMLHGTADDLEPYRNVERVAKRLSDAVIVAFPGLGHFAPWLWPDLPFAMFDEV